MTPEVDIIFIQYVSFVFTVAFHTSVLLGSFLFSIFFPIVLVTV